MIPNTFANTINIFIFNYLKNFITHCLATGFMLLCFCVNAQTSRLDSLNKILSSDAEDTIKVNALISVSSAISNKNLDSSIGISETALQLSEKIVWHKGVMNAEFLLGQLYYLKGNYSRSLNYYLSALKKVKAANQPVLQAAIFNSIGNIYVLEGDYNKALENYSFVLKHAEKDKDTARIASVASNIGLTYSYARQAEKGLVYLFRSLKLHEAQKNERGVAKTLDFIGYTFFTIGKYPEALKHLLLSLEKNEKTGDKIRILDNLRNLGWVYIRTGEFNKAESCLKKALVYSEEVSHLQGIEGVNEALTKLYDTTGRAELAFEHYKKYITAHDSINSAEGRRAQLRSEMNYEFEKKEAVIKEQQEKERAIAEEKNRFQKIVITSVLFGLVLVVIFSLFIFRSLRTTKQQKIIIEEKQKEILDSIHYAKRIQTSLLPTEKYLEKHLNN